MMTVTAIMARLVPILWGQGTGSAYRDAPSDDAPAPSFAPVEV